jgi:hypothetical protein
MRPPGEAVKAGVSTTTAAVELGFLRTFSLVIALGTNPAYDGFFAFLKGVRQSRGDSPGGNDRDRAIQDDGGCPSKSRKS